MTPDEARLAYDALRSLVAESPLAWVLPNVDDEIQRGKPGTRSLQKTGEREAVYFEPSAPYGGKKGRYEEFTTVTPFDPNEQLHLLTLAIDRVLREIPTLQRAALSGLAEFGAREIVFADDGSEREYSLTSVPSTEDSSRELSLMLAQFER